VRSLSPEECRCIEYIEEPLQDPLLIPDLFRRTRSTVRFALDESLSQAHSGGLDGLLGLDGLTAVVLKPTILGGLNR
jgi:o-succinylbenzoate synthase